MDANIVHQRSASTNLSVRNYFEKVIFFKILFLQVISPITLDNNNKTVIILTQPDIDTKVNSTNQLIISLSLRYALECTKKCQINLKESIFAKTFQTLELPIDTCK